MYHVTFKSKLNKILQEGLTIGHNRNWHTPFGVMLGDKDKIYLFKRYSSAVSWGASIEYNTNKKAVILKVNTPLNLEQDTNTGATVGDWYKTTDCITKNNILEVIPLTLNLIRELTSGKLELKD